MGLDEFRSDDYDGEDLDVELPDTYDSFRTYEPEVPEWWEDLDHKEEKLNNKNFDGEKALVITENGERNKVCISTEYVDLEDVA